MQTFFIFMAYILAILILVLPKLVKMRVWVLRKLHLFKLADWYERNQFVIVRVVRIIFLVAIIILLLLVMGNF